ncbi:hypothetical protein [Mycolicibacterium goodii]|uniref:hypothetical protein n=1 Tax=Mycolicibacterium goodii TaxID=134601 RepID=UPI001BDDAC90|nr:hypothetical protein [Mycolicibacterium goodii]MBU8833830.1 hypothetical protein [Mycolicibacterium goodii]
MPFRDQSATNADGAELRAYLLAEAEGLRDLLAFGDPALDELFEEGKIKRRPARHSHEVGEAVYGELDRPVQQLADGGEYRLRRNDLPDWHAERFAGGSNDEFVLGADDVL